MYKNTSSNLVNDINIPLYSSSQSVQQNIKFYHFLIVNYHRQVKSVNFRAILQNFDDFNTFTSQRLLLEEK